MSITAPTKAELAAMQLLEPALLGLIDLNCKFIRPTFIGDTIKFEVEVIESREISKPDRGIVTFRRTAIIQNNETTVECIVKMLMLKRSAVTRAQ